MSSLSAKEAAHAQLDYKLVFSLVGKDHTEHKQI